MNCLLKCSWSMLIWIHFKEFFNLWLLLILGYRRVSAVVVNGGKRCLCTVGRCFVCSDAVVLNWVQQGELWWCSVSLAVSLKWSFSVRTVNSANLLALSYVRVLQHDAPAVISHTERFVISNLHLSLSFSDFHTQTHIQICFFVFLSWWGLTHGFCCCSTELSIFSRRRLLNLKHKPFGVLT